MDCLTEEMRKNGKSRKPKFPWPTGRNDIKTRVSSRFQCYLQGSSSSSSLHDYIFIQKEREDYLDLTSLLYSHVLIFSTIRTKNTGTKDSKSKLKSGKNDELEKNDD
jgi:hypothetical protein